MPLKGIPDSISPDLLFALAKMGHGDELVIADANFPSDSVATSTTLGAPIRVGGVTTAQLLNDILVLLPLDQYKENPVAMMDRVDSDKAKDLTVPAYGDILTLVNLHGPSGGETGLEYVERFAFYERAKKAFCVVQTTDRALYANCIVSKGVL